MDAKIECMKTFKKDAAPFIIVDLNLHQVVFERGKTDKLLGFAKNQGHVLSVRDDEDAFLQN